MVKINARSYTNILKEFDATDQNTALLLTGDIKYFEYMRVKKNSFKTDQVLKEIENIYNLV